MNKILSALKATYNFFSGDAITLTATLVAFVLCWILSKAAGASSAVIGVLLVVIVVTGLVITLGREVAGRPRARA